MKRLLLCLLAILLMVGCTVEEPRDTNMYKIELSGVDINLEELIPDESINRLMVEDLILLEKYFYAKELAIFEKQEDRDYFSKYLWYSPKAEKKDIVFNEIELENLSKISERIAKISVNKDRIRTALVYYDINGDGELEEILLDRWHTKDEVDFVYDRVRVYHYQAGERNMIFNSEEVLGPVEGVYFDESDQLLLIDDLNGNGLNEMYLQHIPEHNTVSRITMFEYDGSVFKKLFDEPLSSIVFKDLNDDGKLEMSGKYAEGLADGFNPPVYKSFEFLNGEYRFSKELTNVYVKSICLQEREAFFVNPSEKAYMNILSLYAMTTYYEEGLTFLENGYPYIEGLERDFDESFYKIMYEDQRKK